MKKITTLFFLIFFSQLAIAQSKKNEYNIASEKDLKTLKTIASVKPEQEQRLLDFFYRKYKDYSIGTLTLVDKKQLEMELEAELKGLLDPSESIKLDNNKKIFVGLVSE
jgi:hypothetical protein